MEDRADHYYGSSVTNYEKVRSQSPIWQKEQQAINDFVITGPVLDVPFGTGRYFTIYDSKSLCYTGVDISPDMLRLAHKQYPSANIQLGDVFDLPFTQGQFSTVVCSRLLHWLKPEDVCRAMAELRRVSDTIVVSIIIGEKASRRSSGTWTHELSLFYQIINGLYIENRAMLSKEKNRSSEMFKLRKPCWQDVVKQFSDTHDPVALINRLSNVWTRRYGLQPVDLVSGVITIEHWTGGELGTMLDDMDAVAKKDKTAKGSMITTTLPRSFDCPIVVFRTQGHTIMIDGRRRCNQWRYKEGYYQVLVIGIEP